MSPPPVLPFVSPHERPALSRVHLLHVYLLGISSLLLLAVHAGRAQQPNQRGQTSGTPIPAVADTTTPRTFQGRVVNALTGQPISRALVRLNSRAVLTDHDGNFLFAQVTDPYMQLTATKPGYFPGLDPQEQIGIPIQLDHPPAAAIELRLYPEALLTGTVTSRDGTPLSHVPVTARRAFFDEQGLHWNPTEATQTDSHGNFRLPVQAGDYKLELRSTQRTDGGQGEIVMPMMLPEADPAGKLHAIRLQCGEEQHFDLRPITSKTYKVTVVSDVDFTRSYPRVSARASDGTQVPINLGRTSGGDFTLNLPSGSYTLTANLNSKETQMIAQTNVTVAARDLSGVALHFMSIPAIPLEMVIESSATTPAAAINGGDPRAGSSPGLQQFNLFLQSDGAELLYGDGSVRLFSRPDKSFVFNTPPGTYHVKSFHSGSVWYIKAINYGTADLLRQELVVAPGAGDIPIRITVSDATGKLTGKVKRADTTGHSWVYLIASDPSAYPVMTLSTNDDGLYTFDRVPPGSYRVVAFEHRRALDLTDASVMAALGAHVRSVTVAVGDKPTLDLDAVLGTEVQP